MVICIVGILGMLSIPRFHSMLTQSKLNTASSELYAALAYAEDLAVRYQRPFGVKADVAENYVRVFDNRYKADPNPHFAEDPPVYARGVVRDPVSKKRYRRDFDNIEIYQGVKITAVPAGGEICFYPDGHSSAGNNSIILGFGGEQRTVTVVGMTGVITITSS